MIAYIIGGVIVVALLIGCVVVAAQAIGGPSKVQLALWTWLLLASFVAVAVFVH